MFFWNQLSTWGETPALFTDSRSVTYVELAFLSDQFAKQLPARKSLIQINIDNSIEAVAAILGTLRAGHAVMFGDASNEVLNNRLAHSYLPDFIYSKCNGAWKLELHQVNPAGSLHEDLALVISSSGSTGSSKTIRLSKESVQFNTSSIADFLKLDLKQKAALVLPLTYSYGLSVLNSHLSVGGAVYLIENSVVSETFTHQLRDRAITSFAGVPYTFELLDRVGFQKEHLPDLQYVTQAGGQLSHDLVEKFSVWARNNSKDFVVMYGQSEACARIAYMPPKHLETYPDCIGIAIPGGHLSLQDGNGKTIEAIDTPGELVYEGKNVMLGYASTTADLEKGREVTQLSTGDIGCINDAGFYYITGRKNRIAKLEGRRYNLVEVESFVREMDKSAVCVSDDHHLFIGSDAELANETVKATAKRFGIAEVKISSHQFQSLPRLSSGKIDYTSVLSSFTNRHDSKTSAATWRSENEVKEKLIACYAASFPEQQVNGYDSFASLGGDSLTYVGISIEIEALLGKLPERWEFESVQRLASQKHLNPRAPSRPHSVKVETSIILRVYAILAIVATHAGVFELAGGAALLMMLAGMNYSRFHLDHLLKRNFTPLVYSVIKNLLLPYWLLLWLSNFYQQGFTVSTTDFLLVGNLTRDFYPSAPFLTWFIQALVQAILLACLPLMFKPIRFWVSKNTLGYGVLLLSAATLWRVIDGAYGIGLDNFPNDQRTAWVFWLFCFGLVFTQLKTMPQKLVCHFIVVSWALLFFSGDASRIFTISISAGLLIWLDRMPVTQAMIPFIKTLGSASIFIYLTHLTGVVSYFPPTDTYVGIGVRFFLGIAQGVLVWQGYRYIESSIVQRLARRRISQEQV